MSNLILLTRFSEIDHVRLLQLCKNFYSFLRKSLPVLDLGAIGQKPVRVF